MKKVLLRAISVMVIIYPFTSIAQDFWQQTSGPDGGMVTGFSINSNRQLFAGTWGQGVFRSMDDGVSWTHIISGLTNKHIRTFAINTNGHIFAGTQGGVFRSMDNGDSWTQAHAGITVNVVYSLAINSSGHLFAGT